MSLDFFFMNRVYRTKDIPLKKLNTIIKNELYCVRKYFR